MHSTPPSATGAARLHDEVTRLSGSEHAIAVDGTADASNERPLDRAIDWLAKNGRIGHSERN